MFVLLMAANPQVADPGTTAFAITLVIHAVIFFPIVIVGLFSLWKMNLPLLARHSFPKLAEPIAEIAP